MCGLLNLVNKIELNVQHTWIAQATMAMSLVSTVPQSCGKSRILAYFPHSRIFARTSSISGSISK